MSFCRFYVSHRVLKYYIPPYLKEILQRVLPLNELHVPMCTFTLLFDFVTISCVENLFSY